MFRSLGDFLNDLERRGELVRVPEEVSAELEITALADAAFKSGGPALLFENVRDRDFPLVIGLFGTPERTARALGVGKLDDLAARVQRLLELKPAGGLAGALAMLPKLGELKGLFPRKVRRAPVQEVVQTGEAVDLGRLPVQTCWPGDGGPFVTLPQVITKDPETGECNVGMYRMQVFGPRSTAMHWQLYKTGRRHFEKARKLGKRLEVAVALGGDPVLTYAATAPLPELPGLYEYHLAGFLRGRPVELARAKTVDLWVPAEAEFVLEGYVDPAEPFVTEGPFGDHTGFYTPPSPYPLFHVTALTHRRGAVYPSTVVGPPPMEDAWLIEASERIFLPAARLVIPEIRDYHMPPAGVAHNWVNVEIEKSYAGQGFKVASGLLGLGQMMSTKVVVVTSDAPPKPGFGALLAAVRHLRPERDVVFGKGPTDELDHAPAQVGFSGKLILDGTVKLEAEGPAAPPPAPPGPAEHPDVTAQHAWPGVLAVTIEKRRPGQVRALARRLAADPAVRLLLVADGGIDPADPDALMWWVLANLDPARDAWIEAGRTLVLDGTRKLPEEGARPWPDVARLDEKTLERLRPLAERLRL
ncbi:MAG TPA: menaquinone biosynthesis decarboxylase [Oceanithermus profundus]|uniref:Menaquinone biosynthesis decarboxylase n=1 Tax=Oceanithermus profundus TaxID=187137 RepID=A0A7C4V608_9DEIN|nr:menaquinone biosynthesis decarboxylase [Oceanithermus profundus]